MGITSREPDTVRGTAKRPQFSRAFISVTVQLWTWVFWVISVYFNIRNTLPKFCPFLLGHHVYIYIYIYIYILINTAFSLIITVRELLCLGILVFSDVDRPTNIKNNRFRLHLTASNRRRVRVLILCTLYFNTRGPGSVIGIATAYGLDGPGIESPWGEILRTCPDRP